MTEKDISATIEAHRPAIAEAVAARRYAEHPELDGSYGPTGRKRALEDANDHVSVLAQAIALGTPGLFVDYLGWLKVVLARGRVLLPDLLDHLEYLQAGLRQALVPEAAETACAYVAEGARLLPELPDKLPTLIEDDAPLAPLARQYLQALRRGERHAASQLILDAVGGGTAVKDIYLGVFQSSLREIGRLWQMNEVSIAQEHYCTAATQMIMSQLYPYIVAGEKGTGRMLGTCDASELHELGVRLVADFFEMAGWDTCYLGANMPTDSIVAALVEPRVDVLCISATLTYHVSDVEPLIQAVRLDAACHDTIILVGGYPFNLAPDLWRRVGADGSAPDAQVAVARATELMAARRLP